MNADVVMLAHGAGGRKSAELIRDLFLRRFGNPVLDLMGDSAVLDFPGRTLAFTTDSFVVDPIFFPGGDIGRLSVCGTVNDLAASGARPIALSAAFILEEGLEITTLERVAGSMAYAAAEAGVSIIAGDTKVVPRGSADRMFVTTSGVGVLSGGPYPSPERAAPGDAVILSGTVGDHGMSVMTSREGISLESGIASDCAPLSGLVALMLDACPEVHCLRDPTRGGLAASLNEIAAQSGVCIEIDESAVPVDDGVRVACELLGIDPLHVANEGKMLAVVTEPSAQQVLEAMLRHPYGKRACTIGRVLEHPAGRVHLRTALGVARILDMPAGDLLPRIC